MLDAAAVVMVGEQPEDKPARAETPKPATAYLVVNAGWAPDPWMRLGWRMTSALPTFPTLKEARAERAALEAQASWARTSKSAPGPKRKVIVEATTTYRLVEDRGCG
jgi:hypothetical protein